MWWQFWAVMLSILLLSIAMIWCVVLCAMRCFYPEGTRDPKVRALLPGRADDRPAGAAAGGALSRRDGAGGPARAV